ncbi:MAG: hypothetical protein LBT47_08270 [Deltaproteobacteria bacterium]|jgi:hypothetical protein|nr:hypothetical protein [Deltaproteobacteria bacterium]
MSLGPGVPGEVGAAVRILAESEAKLITQGEVFPSDIVPVLTLAPGGVMEASAGLLGGFSRSRSGLKKNQDF